MWRDEQANTNKQEREQPDKQTNKGMKNYRFRNTRISVLV
jgi:hypothetical protein